MELFRFVTQGKQKTIALIVFCVVAYAIAWPASLMVGGVIRMPVSIPPVLLLALVSCAPAIGALAALAVERDPESKLAFRRRLFQWRVGLRWVAVAAFLPAAIYIGGAAIFTLFGTYGQPQWGMLAILPVLLILNSGEEIGWRGYLYPRLNARLSPLAASLVLGLLWGLLHLGLYIGLYPNWPVVFALLTAMTLGQAVIMTWISQPTRGSLLPMVVCHSSFDLASQVLSAARASSTVGLWGAVAIVMWVVAGFLAARLGTHLSNQSPVQVKTM